MTRSRIVAEFSGSWVRAHFFVVHGGDVDVDVDAVHERAGNFGDVALDHRSGALAVAGAVVVETAGAGIHGGGEHEAGGEGERHGGAGDADCAVFERLAQDFEDVAGEFGEFVEKEQAVVGERNFAGARDDAAADQSGVGDGVVRRAVGAGSDQAGALVEDSGDAVNLGGLERFFEGERRQDRGHALGEHGLAGAGRADHEDVVASGAGDFDGALGGLLSADVFEVDEELLRFAQQGIAVGFDGNDAVAGVDEVDHVEQRAHGVDVDAGDHGGFFGVGFGNDHAGDLSSAGFDGDGQGSANAANTAVEGEFSDEEAVGHFFFGEAAVGSDDAEGHGQVESGAFFLDVGGGEVDGDVGGGNVVAAVLQRGADAVAALADGGVGQADGVEVVLIALDAGAVDFDLNDVGVDAVDGGAESFIEHEVKPRPSTSLRAGFLANERARNGAPGQES